MKAFLVRQLTYSTLMRFFLRRLYHNTNHRGLGLLGRQQVLGTSISDAGMRPAAPVPVVIQDEGCLGLLVEARGRGLLHGWQPCPLPCCLLVLPWHNMSPSLHPAFLQTTVNQCPLAPGVSITSLCSSWPPSLAISPSPSGRWFKLGLLKPCSRDKLS